jgi:D-alanine-D-alanine ligase
MQSAVAEATRFEPEILCEEFIEGAEITCPVIGSGESASALPIIKIVAPEGKYDYENKYFTDVTSYQCPSGLPADVERQVQSLVLRAYRALGCRGWARADLMLRASDGKAFLLEMNTSPGMTGHSLVPKSASAAGIDYPSLCMLIAGLAQLDHARLTRASSGAA